MKALFQSNTISSKNIVLIKLCILIERLMAIHLVVTRLFVTDRCRVTSLQLELWWLVAEGRNITCNSQNLCGRWFKGKYMAIRYKFEAVASSIIIKVMKKSSAWSLIGLLKIHKWNAEIPFCVRGTQEQAWQTGLTFVVCYFSSYLQMISSWSLSLC